MEQMESTEFVADFVTTAGAVNVDCFVLMSLRITFSGERLTVSGDCLPMLTKMAPRNVMPSLFIAQGVSTVSTVHSPFSFSFILPPPHSLLLEQMTKRRLH